MSSTGSLGEKPPTAWQKVVAKARSFLMAKRNVNEVRQAAAHLPARKVFVNMPVPEADLPEHAQHFCTNAITTAQYSLINFLPKNLSRQFMRIANVYFLVLTILQLISYFSLGSRFLTVVPIILVLAITAIKDGFEDWRRHISDRHFNETPTRIVRNLRNTNLKWQDDQAEIAKERRMHRLRINMARRLEKKTLYNQIPPDWEESQNPIDASSPPVLNEEAKWRNVRIGDFVILRTGDPAPADMLMLATSADDGSCYVETKNLDGETNLKPRASLAETAGVRDADGCGRLKAIIEVDPPTADMTKINGSIRVFAAPEPPVEDEATPPFMDFAAQGFSATSPIQASISGPPAEGYGMPENNSFEMRQLGTLRQAMPMKHSPLAKAITKPQTLQSYSADDASGSGAGEVVDNMATVVNKNPASSDMGKSMPGTVEHDEPLLIPFSISNVLLRGMTVRNTDWIVGIVLYTGEQTKIVLNSGPTPYKRSRIERMMNIQVFLCFGYVFVMSFVVALVGGLKYAEEPHRHSMYVDDTMQKGTYGFALFWSAMIMLQNVIPIALYVSIEFVKSWHAYWIYQDMNMYYEPTDQRCIARNWNISDDLGQVSYIFSDKTGTLTRNVMDFRMCTINGTIYGKQLPGDELDVVKGRMAQEEVDRNNPPEGGANPFFQELQDEEIQDETFDPMRPSTATSILSHGTSQYDSSPLISTASGMPQQTNSRLHRRSPRIQPVQISAVRSRARTLQPMTDVEAMAKRKQMIGAYLQAMRNVFDPKYVEIGNESTGEGGSYTFVDPQIFYDMKPEVAPPDKVIPTPIDLQAPQSPTTNELGLTLPPQQPRTIHRMGSRRSLKGGFDVDPTRQKNMIDLFFTELATCHSVVVEKSFQKQVASDVNDDATSTIRKFTRMFHNRSGSRKITDMVRHRRHRSKHHRRNEHGHTDSVATMASTGTDGVEWVASESALAEMGRSSSNGSNDGAGPSMRHNMSDGGDSQNGLGYSSAPGSRLRMGDDGHPYYSEETAMSPPTDYMERSQSGSPPEEQATEEKTDLSKMAYSAESPDEGALVRAAKNFGYTFLGRVKNTIYLDIHGERQQYEVLDTIEFNSTRKRMSSILRRPPPYNDIIVFSKGADNVMIERLAKLPSIVDSDIRPFASHEELAFERTMRERTFTQIDEFANAGLRTLMLCYRHVTEEEWARWSTRYHAAQASVESDREEQMAMIADEMESDLLIAGATAIEDKLQEKVPETIASLRAAGIKIWVLTGDKMETAINIGFAANLLTKEMELWTINSSSGAEKVVSRFKLIARIMKQTAINDLAYGKYAITPRPEAVRKPSTANVQLQAADATALGSVSYKIGRAKKFLNIGQSIRRHSRNLSKSSWTHRRNKTAETIATQASGTPQELPHITHTSASNERTEFPRLNDDHGEHHNTINFDLGNDSPGEDLTPNEVQQSIDFLRRQSAEIDGLPHHSVDGTSYHPLNALVIDGKALSQVFADEECKQLLLEIAPLFKSVVCCRASPLQKAEVVKLVKDGLDLVTLAIGDGANDVSMIQTADIGVAISGEEGLQASMASDYTVGRFHFLQNLLLVHGLFDYLRMSEMILSFFYKNVIWAMVPFWYSIYCQFSANVFYDLSYLQLYNVVFTVAPVVILGCVDKPFNYKTAMTYVAVYMDGIRNRYFKWWRYYAYFVDGIYQSVVIFFTFYLFNYKSTVANSNGKVWGNSDFSTGPTVAVVVAASLCVGLNSWQWNWMMGAAVGFSITVCFVYIAIASQFKYFTVGGSANAVFVTIEFWFGLVLSVVVALLPRFSVRAWQKMNKPRDLDIIREIKVMHRPWYGQVFVEPDEEVQFPPDTPKKHRKWMPRKD